MELLKNSIISNKNKSLRVKIFYIYDNGDDDDDINEWFNKHNIEIVNIITMNNYLIYNYYEMK